VVTGDPIVWGMTYSIKATQDCSGSYDGREYILSEGWNEISFDEPEWYHQLF